MVYKPLPHHSHAQVCTTEDRKEFLDGWKVYKPLTHHNHADILLEEVVEEEIAATHNHDNSMEEVLVAMNKGQRDTILIA